MNKKRFLVRLKRALRGLGVCEIQSRLAFYAEMIDDRVEEGMTEKDAVLEIGEPEEIAKEILSEMKAEGKKTPRSMGASAKILIALGSPVWLSLLIAAAAILFSLAVSAFAVALCVFVCLAAALVSLYAAVICVGVSGAACVAFGGVCLFTGRALEAMLVTGAGFVLASLAIWAFLACTPIGKGLFYAICEAWKRIARFVFRRRAQA